MNSMGTPFRIFGIDRSVHVDLCCTTYRNNFKQIMEILLIQHTMLYDTRDGDVYGFFV